MAKRSRIKATPTDPMDVANSVGYAICEAQGLFAGARALAINAKGELGCQIQYCIDAGNRRLDEMVESLYAAKP